MKNKKDQSLQDKSDVDSKLETTRKSGTKQKNETDALNLTSNDAITPGMLLYLLICS